MSGRLELAPAADVLVVGSGLAGLVAALRLGPRRVRILTKTDRLAGGASLLAQGGIAAALGPRDSPRLHAADTLEAGAGLADPSAVALLTRQAAAAIGFLARCGVRFDRDGSGAFALGREGAHSERRIVHAAGDGTGAEIVRALEKAVHGAAHVEPLSGACVEDLVVEDGRVVGVIARHAGRLAVHPAGAVVLATGGIGRTFAATTNPPEATGDGLAIAARAGAILADLEFVQFHPTALDVGLDPMPLLSEALRGEGARVVDRRGRPLLESVHPLGDLAPRDVAARAIARAIERGTGAFLDARRAASGRLAERFPGLLDRCRVAGLDPSVDLLPVRPAAHFHMGGVAVDSSGRTSLPGLWACGEVAAAGVHGANRLASNSLLEAVVFGMRVAADVHACAPAPPKEEGVLRRAAGLEAPGAGETAGRAGRLEARLRRIVSERCGVFRDADGLARALAEIEAAGRESAHGGLRNLVTVARLLLHAASIREESRGAHFRADRPEPDPRWRRRLFLRASFRGGSLEGVVVEPDAASVAPSAGVPGLCG